LSKGLIVFSLFLFFSFSLFFLSDEVLCPSERKILLNIILSNFENKLENMAISSELKVYKASYDLLLYIYQISSNFSREFKYSIGEDIKKEVLEILTNIYQANSSFSERKSNINLARSRVQKIIIYTRVLKDLKQVNLKKFIALSEKIEIIDKQLNAWQKSV
jgi:hypothetical protein